MYGKCTKMFHRTLEEKHQCSNYNPNFGTTHQIPVPRLVHLYLISDVEPFKAIQSAKLDNSTFKHEKSRLELDSSLIHLIKLHELINNIR